MDCDSCGQTDAECHCYINKQFDKLFDLCDANSEDVLNLVIIVNSLEKKIEKLEKLMDKAYKKLIKKEKSLESDTKKVLAKDSTRDKFVEAGKKAMKHAKKK